MRHILMSSLLAVAICGPAGAFVAQNGLRVEAGDGTSFHVPWTGRSEKSAFWCAAGDYAIRVLKVPPDTRIYRTSPPPRRQGQGVRFDLDASRAVPSGIIRLQGGLGLPAAHARLKCNRYTALW